MNVTIIGVIFNGKKQTSKFKWNVLYLNNLGKNNK